MLVDEPKSREIKNAVDPARSRFALESDSLLRDLKRLEDSYGKDALILAVVQGYVERLLSNLRVSRYLERKHSESLNALQLWLQKRQLAEVT